jgi:hypothetical protein
MLTRTTVTVSGSEISEIYWPNRSSQMTVIGGKRSFSAVNIRLGWLIVVSPHYRPSLCEWDRRRPTSPTNVDRLRC